VESLELGSSLAYHGELEINSILYQKLYSTPIYTIPVVLLPTLARTNCTPSIFIFRSVSNPKPASSSVVVVVSDSLGCYS
jgi:hypothetical protein